MFMNHYYNTPLSTSTMNSNDSELRQNIFSWTLLSFLGSGAFGIVWKAFDPVQSIDFALKVSHLEPERAVKQRRECTISSQLAHDNLVQVNGFIETRLTAAELKLLIPPYDNNCRVLTERFRRGFDTDVIAISMQFCGEDLRTWFKRRPNPKNAIVHSMQIPIVRGMLEGLQYLHYKRIIHRDLKPENMLFSSPGFVLPIKIGDYGLCRLLKVDQISPLTSAVGTPVYRAPETLTNRYSFQSDIYSMGLIIWEVLQLMGWSDAISFFNRLVYDSEESLIKLYPVVDYLSPLVTSMTKSNPSERVQTVIEAKLLIKSFPITARTAEELTQILDKNGNFVTVNLEEGVYEGCFTIKGIGVTLTGDGTTKTIIRALAGSSSALVAKGDGLTASNFAVEGTGGKCAGVKVQGRNCTFENLHFTKCIAGIAVRGTRKIKFASPGRRLHPYIMNYQVSGISLEQCEEAVLFDDSRFISRKSCFIIYAIVAGLFAGAVFLVLYFSITWISKQ